MKYSLMLLMLSCMTACTSTEGHKGPIPNAVLDDQVVKTPLPIERSNARAVERYLECPDIQPIAVVAERELLSNQSGNHVVPRDFRIMALSVLSDFGPKVEVYTSDRQYVRDRIDSSEYLKGRSFEIEGAITAFDEDLTVISSGIDFGLEFGRGDGETSNDNRNRNTDRVSKMTLDLFFKQNGKLYESFKGEIDVRSTNRGYNFGLRVNDSGFGVNAYKTKSDGLGDSLRKLTYAAFSQLIQDSIYRKMTESQRNNCQAYNRGRQLVSKDGERKNKLVEELNRDPNKVAATTAASSRLKKRSKTVQFLNEKLSKNLFVPTFLYNDVAGVMNFDGEIKNLSKRKQIIEYRVEWLDFEGRMIDDSDVWHGVLLLPQESQRITASAKRRRAKVASLKIRKKQ